MDISVALGGGGARGFAHIGVLRCLKKAGFRVRTIAGTSAGGIVACMFAAGITPDEIAEHGLRVNQNKLYSSSSHSGPALIGLSNVDKILTEIIGDRNFSDLKIPCAVVAVDINSNREVILNKGRIVDALLATIAVPGIFPPKQINGSMLVDGGVLNPVPVSVARYLENKFPVVAVVLSSPMARINKGSLLRMPVKIPSLLANRITHLRVAQAFSIFMQSVDLGQRMITELRLEVDRPDYIIRPEVDKIGLLDKVDINAVVRLGESAALDMLRERKTSLFWARRLPHQLFRKKSGT